MQHTSLFLALALAASTVHAAGFSTQYSGITLKTNWLVATCKSTSGSSVTSSVCLPSWVSNNGGTLQWAVDGRFEQSCTSCSLINGGSTLQCSCLNQKLQPKVSTLDLETGISSSNGQLAVSVAGSSDPNPSTGSLPVPSSFVAQAALIPDDGIGATPGSELFETWVTPETCWTLDLAGPLIPIHSVQNMVNPGYELAVYGTADCSGTPLAIIAPSDTTAHTFSREAMGIAVTPLWNFA